MRKYLDIWWNLLDLAYEGLKKLAILLVAIGVFIALVTGVTAVVEAFATL